MNRMKKSFLVGLLAVVGLSSCGPFYPVEVIDWTAEGEVVVDDSYYNDFLSDKITFKVSWDDSYGQDVVATVRTPWGNEIYEGGPDADGCYFSGTFAQSSSRLVSIIECPDSFHGNYDIFVENTGFEVVNTKIDVIESYYNGHEVIQEISTQSRNILDGDQVRVSYDF